MGVSAQKVWRRKRLNRRMAVIEKLCERVAAGESVADVCRDPMFPPRATMMYWCGAEPALGQMLTQARETCPEAMRAYHAYSDEIAEEVLARVRAGRGLAEVCAEGDMPAVGSVYRWLDERPAFAARYVRAKEAQAERLFDLAWRLACEAEADPDAVRVARLQISTLKWRVAQLAPRRYARWKMQDPPAAAGEGDGGKPKRLIVEVRNWASGPGNRVLETTRLERGLTRVESWRLARAVGAGRFTESPEGQLAEVAWRDFDCGPPPADLVEMDRKAGVLETP